MFDCYKTPVTPRLCLCYCCNYYKMYPDLFKKWALQVVQYVCEIWTDIFTELPSRKSKEGKRMTHWIHNALKMKTQLFLVTRSKG